MTIGHYESDLDGAGVRVGIVQARFNEKVCKGLLKPASQNCAVWV
jgi:6,7-dimethyl-8-ribityllumazine synthase